MPDNKKSPSKPATEPFKSERIQTPAPHDYSSTRDESWRKWKVKPVLELMLTKPPNPPESGIGSRIAYCRGQLDNLSVEALARYTKHFDTEGISRQSLIRYEAGETTPGARELRILCDALWVPVGWLIFGLDEGRSEADFMLRNALFRMLVEMNAVEAPITGLDSADTEKQDKIEQRQRWIHEARQPQPR